MLMPRPIAVMSCGHLIAHIPLSPHCTVHGMRPKEGHSTCWCLSQCQCACCRWRHYPRCVRGQVTQPKQLWRHPNPYFERAPVFLLSSPTARPTSRSPNTLAGNTSALLAHSLPVAHYQYSACTCTRDTESSSSSPPPPHHTHTHASSHTTMQFLRSVCPKCCSPTQPVVGPSVACHAAPPPSTYSATRECRASPTSDHYSHAWQLCCPAPTRPPNLVRRKD